MSADRTSTFNHPYQLRGRQFKTRTYKTEAAMDAAAAKALADSYWPNTGWPVLRGLREFQPKGMPHDWYEIKTYYPEAERVW
jgi:hypothetical protein